MAYLDYIRLAVDGGLFAALLVLAVRFLRATGPQINHLKLVELDASLKALVKEADAASRSLNDQLLKRQKGLEQLLFDLQTSEGKLSRLITSCEEQKGILDLRLSRAQNFTRDVPRAEARAAVESLAPEYSEAPRAAAPRSRAPSPSMRRPSSRNQRIEIRDEELDMSIPAEEPAVEPPSFEQIVPVKAARTARNSQLEQKIERFVDREESAPAAASSSWQEGAEDAFSHIAESAERINESVEMSIGEDESMNGFEENPLYDDPSVNLEAAGKGRDPRLGVLGRKQTTVL